MAASTPCAIKRHVSRYLGAEPGIIRADSLAARAAIAKAEAEAKSQADAAAAVQANQIAAARFALTGQVTR